MTELEILSFALKEKIIAICMENGLTGFAGTFRTEGNDTITFWAEAPGHKDGLLKAIGERIGDIYRECGADHISHSEGIYKPPEKKG